MADPNRPNPAPSREVVGGHRERVDREHGARLWGGRCRGSRGRSHCATCDQRSGEHHERDRQAGGQRDQHPRRAHASACSHSQAAARLPIAVRRAVSTRAGRRGEQQHQGERALAHRDPPGGDGDGGQGHELAEVDRVRERADQGRQDRTGPRRRSGRWPARCPRRPGIARFTGRRGEAEQDQPVPARAATRRCALGPVELGDRPGQQQALAASGTRRSGRSRRHLRDQPAEQADARNAVNHHWPGKVRSGARVISRRSGKVTTQSTHQRLVQVGHRRRPATGAPAAGRTGWPAPRARRSRAARQRHASTSTGRRRASTVGTRGHHAADPGTERERAATPSRPPSGRARRDPRGGAAADATQRARPASVGPHRTPAASADPRSRHRDVSDSRHPPVSPVVADGTPRSTAAATVGPGLCC